jgi:acyl transferase domain-containing protein/thioesterase domain-containing protein
MTDHGKQSGLNGSEIAIVGMSGRFPGARNLEEFWQNIRDGVESISFFEDRELEAEGIDPALLRNPEYVKAKGVIEDAELFDASFFGYTPREAETMDPQQRLFLECAWEALEVAGYDADRFEGLIGVFGGVGTNGYFLNNLYPNRPLMALVGDFQMMIGNDKDYATTRVSYKLNLRGPSITVQTGCSTSLVAVAQACQSLLGGECDIALAGASSIGVPTRSGYLYQSGGIKSPDGHCRAFDASAHGTVFSDGAGVVALKRLEDALADGDFVHAVIKSAAVNNDGSDKAGFTAPSIGGQVNVIRTALSLAEVEPDSIGYVEAHGTGTPIGDPIEVAALTQAFRSGTQKNSFCAIGSVKSNIGHTDAAAGIAGLIKTVLILEHKTIPPTLHFERANPEIDFDGGPFFVNTTLLDWKRGEHPRRGGVTSLGIGGTNAHVIVEEAPVSEPSGDSRPWKLLPLSARSADALDDATNRLSRHLRRYPGLDLADVAYTMQTGRKRFDHRRFVVCRDASDAADALDAKSTGRVFTSAREPASGDVIFMFSGQGSQYVNMGLDLYRTEETFRAEIDRCAGILQRHLSVDIRNYLFPEDDSLELATRMLAQTHVTQPVLFALEYALSKLWMSWGVKPAGAVGHSLGEYVAACLAGVFSLEDALELVALRGRLMHDLPEGAMLAVPLSEGEIGPLLPGQLSLAVVNGIAQCVVSGEKAAVEHFRTSPALKGLDCIYLQTSHAFHSGMMDPVLDAFADTVRRIGPKPPRMPFVSNLTGKWITADEATDPAYWARHLRGTVRFFECLTELFGEPDRIFVEVGPGSTLKTLADCHPGRSRRHAVISSIRHPKETRPDSAFILGALGQLWAAGGTIDWAGFYRNESRRRLPLPTYPFERKRHWIGPGEQPGESLPVSTGKKVESENPEEVLAEIWKDALGIDRVEPGDNFFDLGGHSLLAVVMMTRLERQFGIRLPLAALIEAPTFGEFVRLLGERTRPISWSNLVPLHAEGKGTPFFLMHSHGGNILEYRPLANHLKTDRPVYALQCTGLDGSPIADESVEEMAARYLKEIRAVQPSGPYLIGGYCFGGALAFETARMLRAENEEVGMLVLINSGVFEVPSGDRNPAWARRQWSRIRYRIALEWDELSGRPFNVKCRRLAMRARRAGSLVKAGLEGMLDRAPGYAQRRHSLTFHLEKLAVTNDRAWVRYRPASYPGKVLFLRARRQPIDVQADRLMGWGGYLTGDVRLHEVPGFRQNMLDEPRVGEVARLIREAIR